MIQFRNFWNAFDTWMKSIYPGSLLSLLHTIASIEIMHISDRLNLKSRNLSETFDLKCHVGAFLKEFQQPNTKTLTVHGWHLLQAATKVVQEFSR